MKIIKAESAGFCFGVKRAVDTVYKCTETGTDEKIYTYGPIIHNEEVVKDMEKRGVRVIRSEEDLAERRNRYYPFPRCRKKSLRGT